MLSTIAQRAWFAWHCLPRTEKGTPPPIRQLEKVYELSNAQLRKLIMGISKRPGFAELIKMAAALDCDPHWLQSGEGTPPVCSVFVPPGPPARKPKRSKNSAVNGRVLSPDELALFERKARQLAQRPTALRTKSARK